MEGHTPHSLEKKFPKYYESLKAIVHYTCNAPKKEILQKHKIKPIGKDFGCIDERELLEIPLELYLKKGFRGKEKNVLSINCEKLMRDLSKK